MTLFGFVFLAIAVVALWLRVHDLSQSTKYEMQNERDLNNRLSLQLTFLEAELVKAGVLRINSDPSYRGWVVANIDGESEADTSLTAEILDQLKAKRRVS